MRFQLDKNDLEALVLGGGFFGSGGGGTVKSARSLAEHFEVGDYYSKASVEVVSVDEACASDGYSVVVAYLGAPEAIESAQYPFGVEKAVQKIQQRLKGEGHKLAYVVPVESGALGFVVAGLVAARLGLAVVDADGAGRAVPSLQMLTFAAARVNPRPTMLVSQDSGLCVELDVTPHSGDDGSDGHQKDVANIIDNMLRPIVTEDEFHQFGGLAMWIMAPAKLDKALPIRGTLSRALKLGRQLQAGQLTTSEALIDWLRKECDLKAYPLFGPGKLTSAKVVTSGGFDLGKVSIKDDHQRSCTVLYQNESLLAWASDRGQPLAMAPDGLAYFVEGQRQNVFSNGDLVRRDGSLDPAVEGLKVTLIGIEAAPQLRDDKNRLILDSFMEVARSMGYYGPYLPLGAGGHRPLGTGAPGRPIRICALLPIGTDKYNNRILEAIAPLIPQDVAVEVRNLPTGHDCIEDRIDLLQNGYPVVQLARELEREGFQGIWLSDFDMCGVEAAREAIDIPIIGGFPTSAFTALALSQRFSIITILQSTLALQREHVLEYGLSESFASIRSIDCQVQDLPKTEVVVSKVFEAALKAVREDGAESILLGCTGFVGVAEQVAVLLEKALGSYVPVIDPNQAGFSFLVSLVRMRVRPSRLCYNKAS